MARDERPRRLRIGHCFRRGDTALSRLAHCSVARIARTRGDVESWFGISPLQRCRRLPPRRMRLYGGESAFTIASSKIPQVIYRIEQQRGYAYEGQLWSPGFFRVDLTQRTTATLVGSTEPWDIIDVLGPDDVLAAERERRARLLHDAIPKARQDFPAELVFAADQFVITPAGRFEEAARAHAAGDEVRTVIAGYHWFTDWGRDTMISLEGLSLITGRCL